MAEDNKTDPIPQTEQKAAEAEVKVSAAEASEKLETAAGAEKAQEAAVGAAESAVPPPIAPQPTVGSSPKADNPSEIADVASTEDSKVQQEAAEKLESTRPADETKAPDTKPPEKVEETAPLAEAQPVEAVEKTEAPQPAEPTKLVAAPQPPPPVQPAPASQPVAAAQIASTVQPVVLPQPLPAAQPATAALEPLPIPLAGSARQPEQGAQAIPLSAALQLQGAVPRQGALPQPQQAALPHHLEGARRPDAPPQAPTEDGPQALQAELLRRRQELALIHAKKEFEERHAAELAARRAAAQANQAAQYAAQQATHHVVQQAAHQAAHQAAQQVAQQAQEQGYERVAPPRRAASARASQTFKQQAEYFDESPPDSPIDEPPARKPTPKSKPTPKAAAPAGGKSNVQGWEDPPQKQLALKLGDVTKSLTSKWLQLFWPDDGKWWPGQVLSVDSRKKTVTLLYETGEEEANLELSDLIRKGEVAWLHEKDMPKEPVPVNSGGPKRGGPGRGGGMWRSDSFEDELPTASTSRGQAGYRRRQAEEEEEEEEEEPWAPGQKRKAALKSKARYRDESEDESSYSESPPASDQSSDWHSSEDEDKPRRKPKKKKKKTAPPPRPHQHQQQAQPRQSHVSHQLPSGGGNMYGRGGIFDDGPGFGSAFGGSSGMDSLRMQAGQNNPAINRDPLQSKGGFPIERGWGVMTGAPNNPAAAYRAGWPGQPQDLSQLFQNRQQMNNGSMGLHIPQVSMQGPAGLDLTRLGANPAMMGAGGPTISQAPWRPGMSAELSDWASQLGSQGMFRLPQMQQLAVAQQQQQLQAQRMQQQQQAEPPASRPAVNLGGNAKNMEGILSQGLAASGKQVEVQQSNGQWAKGTIVACLARGSAGGSVMVCYDDGRQEQLLSAEEGRTFNIRMT